MAGAYNKGRELSFEMQIGSKKYPEYSIRSLAEAFYQLRKPLGLHSVNAHMTITPGEYRVTKFVIGIDIAKVLGASFSGYSRAGDLTALRIKPVDGVSPPLPIGNLKLHHVLHYDSIMQIMDSGVSVLECRDKKAKIYIVK